MGGSVSSMARASSALDSYVAELGSDISYDRGLSSSRFLKTILARHANGPLVIKIFIKPDSTMSLRLQQRRLKHEREALADISGADTYQMFVETDKAGYLIRQWIGHNLYDRVSIQPYLANIEKKWIAFQLLTCLRDARNQKVPHGDIKSENVLITSDLSVRLTDFSYTFKPTYLPIDDPSDFSFFFDTSGRRTCYLAPERFEEREERERRQADERRRLEERRKRKMTEAKLKAAEKAAEKRRGSALQDMGEGGDLLRAKELEEDTLATFRPAVTEEMDVFSTGCVLAEMWTDGRTVFNLSELFAYREGSLDLEGIMENIEDAHVRDMIAQMLSRDPSSRPKFDHILAEYRGTIFPEYFYTFLEDYVGSLVNVPDRKEKDTANFVQRAAPVSGTKIDRMLQEWGSIQPHLDGSDGDPDGPALLLVNIVTSSIRNCLWPTSKLHGLQLLLNLSPYLQDDERVDRIVPFVVELLSDSTPIIRAEACRTLVTIIGLIRSISPGNAAYIPEYLLPHLRQLAMDDDIFVRATYARGLVKIAEAALAMLEYSQASKLSKAEMKASGVIEPDYDAMLLEIQSAVEEQATRLLTDPAVQVKRATLHNITDLCLFFGRQKSNETVLSHLVTYLNDRDWTLRLAFFEGIVGVGAFIGLKAVEEYVLPLMLQALSDPEEAVVAKVVESLTNLASLGLLARMKLWDCFQAVRGFLCHPDTWIRQGTIAFVAAAAKSLPSSDVWCILYPSLRPLLRSDILDLDERSLTEAVATPLSRVKLIATRTAALENSPPGLWRIPPQRYSAKAAFTKEAVNGRISDAPSMKDKSLTAADEQKIYAMREFILKQAHAIRVRESSDTSHSADAAVFGEKAQILREAGITPSLLGDKAVSLEKLGITPQTVFISPRTIGVDARADLRRLRPHLLSEVGGPSRRSSMGSRSHRGPLDNPLDEIRQRLADFPHVLPVDSAIPPPSAPSTQTEVSASPSESAISSSIDLTHARAGKRRLDPKAAPAVGADHTNAIGLTTIHDETVSASGRTTPTANSSATRTFAAAQHVPQYGSSYEGHDPAVRAFFERVDLENYREPMLDFGPRVVATPKKRPSRAKNSPNQAVTLIAHLTQHDAPITAIVTSPDHSFFATAGRDRQVLIWDTGRLERSVSAKARLQYTMDGPVSAMCGIENTHCLAVASEDGRLDVLRVHVNATTGTGTGGGISAAVAGAGAKYGRIEVIRSRRAEADEGCVTFITHRQDASLLLVTSASIIGLLDIRTMALSHRFQHPLELGSITAFCPSKHWLVVGTELGILSLWDLRFGLLVKSWRAGGAVTAAQIHPSRGRGRWVMCSIERSSDKVPLVEVWDVETSNLVEVYDSRNERINSKDSPYASGPDTIIPSRSELVSQLASRRDFSQSTSTPESADETGPPPTVLALMAGTRLASLSPLEEEGSLLLSLTESKPVQPPPTPGYVVTAGTDRVIRYFDLTRPSEGMVICGSPKQKDVVFKTTTTGGVAVTYTIPASAMSERYAHTASGAEALRASGREKERQRLEGVRETLGGRQPLRPHYDAICALGAVETAVSSCVVSGDRSGVVKVWRIEGGGK